MDWIVPLSDLDYDEAEEAAVLDVVQRRWLTMGGVTRKFEDAFAELTGAAHALAVSNATQALHLACLGLGIGPGDEVIVPSLTFVATANAVLYTGASVRFADIQDINTLYVSPESIEAQITPATKAIIVMHYGGYMCDMPGIIALAKAHDLVVIEDAAHAPGAVLDGKASGTWGDVGCFSFFSNKNIAAGEGGMVVTNRDDIAEKVRLQRSHAMTSLTWDRHKGHAYSYDVIDLGYNYRIDEIRAALGLAQLGKLARNNNRRHEITEAYWQALADTPLELPFKGLERPSAYHIFPVLLPDGVERKGFIDQMRAHQVQTSMHYPPIHQFTYHKKLNPVVTLPVTDAVARREVTLPLYPTMDEAAVQVVLQAVYSALDLLA